MSNASEKLLIVNTGFYSVGHKRIKALDNTTPDGVKTGEILESIIKELMADDWYFNRHSVLLTDMTQIFKLTVDTAPSPAVWSRGATITGATSLVTCEVVDVLSGTVYLVTEPSGDFTDSEVLSDGTNSVDTAADYPQTTENIDRDQYQYGFKEPADSLHIRGIFSTQHDKAKLRHRSEKNYILSHFKDNCNFKYNYYRTESEGVSDVTGLHMWFHRLISAKLAWMLSANITENQKVRAKVEIDYNDVYLEAKEKNGSEEGAIDYSGHNNWAEGANRDLEWHSHNQNYNY